MFERQERWAFVLLAGVALAVISAQAVLGSVGKKPFALQFTPDSVDGELVTVEGHIDQIIPTQSGNNLILSVNNLSIFLPAHTAQGLSLQKGDLITVYGVVQTYRGKKEIVVNSPDDILVKPDLPRHD